MKNLFLLICLSFPGTQAISLSIEPKIVELKAFNVVGMQTFGNPVDGDFDKMWNVLLNFNEEIPHLMNKTVSYGVGTYTQEHYSDDKWFYLAGREVSSLSDVSLQMVGKQIPANQYAVFEYKGAISPELGAFFQHIYKQWLPTSGYTLAGPYDFEKYGEKFLGPLNQNSIIEIYIPIKIK